jgi:uncharacterized protein
MSENINPTERTKIRRIPKRGSYEREQIYQILDEGFVCHIGFTVDEQPYVIPTAYARDGDNLIVHGSAASQMMRAMAWETDVCVTVTLIDGLVLARSAFHHSINYRSVVIFGKAKLISDEGQKMEALRLFTEHLIPNRWAEIRPPNALELKATTVLSLPLDESSAKIRTGDPKDDEEDYEMKVWAGVIPLKATTGKPIDDSRLKDGVSPPDYVSEYKRSE